MQIHPKKPREGKGHRAKTGMAAYVKRNQKGTPGYRDYIPQRKAEV